MSFNTWLDTFIEEKGIDLEENFEVEGPTFGTNYMQVQNIVDAIKETTVEEQEQIKRTIVMLDFKNQPIVPFFKHIAQAIAL